MGWGWVSTEYHLLSTQNNGHHTLGLGGLSRLVHQHGAEAHLGQARVTRPHARAADDVSTAEQLTLTRHPQRLEALLISQ